MKAQSTRYWLTTRNGGSSTSLVGIMKLKPPRRHTLHHSRDGGSEYHYAKFEHCNTSLALCCTFGLRNLDPASREWSHGFREGVVTGQLRIVHVTTSAYTTVRQPKYRTKNDQEWGRQSKACRLEMRSMLQHHVFVGRDLNQQQEKMSLIPLCLDSRLWVSSLNV